MNYYEFKLDEDDIKQCNEALKIIQQLRVYINKELDEITKLINAKIQNSFKKRAKQCNLQYFEQLYCNGDMIVFENQLSNLIANTENIFKLNQNQLCLYNEDQFKSLSINPGIRKLNETFRNLHLNLESAKKLIELNQKQKTNLLVQDFNQQQMIWKHKSVFKSGESFKTFSFNANIGYAETFLCKYSFDLQGIILCQLFSGTNSEGTQLDCQKDKHCLQFCIHEGLDLSSYFYSEDIELDHQKLTKKEQVYEIMLKQNIYLKRGMIYTISLIVKSKQEMTTYMYTGKQGIKHKYMIFFEKQIRQLDQIVNVAQIFTQTPMPGLIILF